MIWFLSIISLWFKVVALVSVKHALISVSYVITFQSGRFGRFGFCQSTDRFQRPRFGPLAGGFEAVPSECVRPAWLLRCWFPPLRHPLSLGPARETEDRGHEGLAARQPGHEGEVPDEAEFELRKWRECDNRASEADVHCRGFELRQCQGSRAL